MHDCTPCLSFAAAPDWDQVWHACLHLPLPYVSVSVVIRDIFAAHYLRDAPVIPNAIDCNVFKPPALSSASSVLTSAKRSRRGARGGASAADGARTLEAALGPDKWRPLSDNTLKRVLLVGNPGLKLKNFKAALDALNVAQRTLEQQGHPGISVTWICQVRPAVTGVTFPVSFAVNPPQDQLPALYGGGHDVFLFTSVYEAWGMPVLEAMASGVPVVCSRCHGVDTFAFHEHNALLAGPYDHRGLGAAVVRVLSSPALASRLAIAGRRTAEELTWGNSMGALETALYQVNHFFGLHAEAGRGSSKLQAAVDKANAAAPRGGATQLYSLPSASSMRAAYAKRISSRLHLVHALQKGVVDVSHTSGMFRWGEGALQHAPLANSVLEGGVVAGGICVHPPKLALEGASAAQAIPPALDWGSSPIDAAVAAMADGICIRSVAVPTGSRRGPRVLPPDSPLALAVPKAKLYAAAVAIAEAHARQGGGESDWDPPPHVRTVAPVNANADSTPGASEAMAQLVAVRPLSSFNLTSLAAAGTLAAQRLDVAGAAGSAHVDTPEAAVAASRGEQSLETLATALEAALHASPRLVQLYALAKRAQLQVHHANAHSAVEGGPRGQSLGGHFRPPGTAAYQPGVLETPPPTHRWGAGNTSLSVVPGNNAGLQMQPAEHTPPIPPPFGAPGGPQAPPASHFTAHQQSVAPTAAGHTVSGGVLGGGYMPSTPPQQAHSDLMRRLAVAAQVSPGGIMASPPGHFSTGGPQQHAPAAMLQFQQQAMSAAPTAPPSTMQGGHMGVWFPPVAHDTLRLLFSQELNTEQLLQHLAARSALAGGGAGGVAHGTHPPQRVDGWVQGQPYTNSFTRNALTGVTHPVAVLHPADPNTLPVFGSALPYTSFAHMSAGGGGNDLGIFSSGLPSSSLVGAPAVSSYGSGAGGVHGGSMRHSSAAPTTSAAPLRTPPPKAALRGDAALWRTLPDGSSDGLATFSGHSTFRGTQAPSPHLASGREIGVHGEFADAQLRNLNMVDWSSELGRASADSDGAQP